MADGKTSRLIEPSRMAMTVWALVVFALAICLRLPSCYESFWVDELHTAWAIWGDFGTVSSRAEQGNQTPLYFQCMWLWKLVVGESEVALRFSSVLAVSLASAVMVIGVSQNTRRLSAGVLAGILLAVESNSIFFGTEFRPYAWLILFSTIATWLSVVLIRHQSPSSKGRVRLMLMVTACLAALFHPTSMATIGILVGSVFIVELIDWRKSSGRPFQFQIAGILCLAVLIATILALVSSSLTNSWEQRDNWRFFGKAQAWFQLWVIWPWIPITLLPLALGVLTAWRKPARESFAALLPALVATIATFVFFIASYLDFVPLWHRRYFIAALPMLAWSAGALPMLGLPDQWSWRTIGVAPLFFVAIVGLLMRGQGTANQLWLGNYVLAARGEDWRGAFRWLREHKKKHELVLLDAGLIESRFLEQPPTQAMLTEALNREQYLTFPARGPYEMPNVYLDTPTAHGRTPVGYVLEALREQLRDNEIIAPVVINKSGRTWIVSRAGQPQIARWCLRVSNTRDPKPIYRRFGSIWVVHFQMHPKPQGVPPELDFSLGRGID